MNNWDNAGGWRVKKADVLGQGTWTCFSLTELFCSLLSILKQIPATGQPWPLPEHRCTDSSFFFQWRHWRNKFRVSRTLGKHPSTWVLLSPRFFRLWSFSRSWQTPLGMTSQRVICSYRSPDAQGFLSPLSSIWVSQNRHPKSKKSEAARQAVLVPWLTPCQWCQAPLRPVVTGYAEEATKLQISTKWF